MSDQQQGEVAEDDLPPVLAPEECEPEDYECEHYSPAEEDADA